MASVLHFPPMLCILVFSIFVFSTLTFLSYRIFLSRIFSRPVPITTLCIGIFSAGEAECNAVVIFMATTIAMAVIAIISITINIVQFVYAMRTSTSKGSRSNRSSYALKSGFTQRRFLTVSCRTRTALHSGNFERYNCYKFNDEFINEGLSCCSFPAIVTGHWTAELWASHSLTVSPSHTNLILSIHSLITQPTQVAWHI